MSQRTIEELMLRIKPRRRVKGIAAALLPFDSAGSIAEDAFAAHLRATHTAGLTNAVNMDTGYVNLLTAEEKQHVLRLTRDALGPGVPFVAGAYIERQEGDPVLLYRREISHILQYGGTPILFQTTRMHGLRPAEKARAYRESVADCTEALAFELGPVFAPNGEIWDGETAARVMEIPQITGIKHSSLDRMTEWERLDLRDRLRPEFRIYTGNDLGISMIEYGSDYLLGLATFCPELFAERDQMWEAGEGAYYPLNDALQHLGNVAFRRPVPAYKHSAAHFLYLQGRVPTPNTHPQSPKRPDWEPDLLDDCATRLGLY